MAADEVRLPRRLHLLKMRSRVRHELLRKRLIGRRGDYELQQRARRITHRVFLVCERIMVRHEERCADMLAVPLVSEGQIAECLLDDRCRPAATKRDLFAV